MIVRDNKTLAQALALVSNGPIRYSDAIRYALVTEPKTLTGFVNETLERGDIAIVVPVGQEQYAENHDWELKVYRKQMKEEEKRLVRKWVSEHRDRVDAVIRRHEQRRS